jgi:hypothetical protein
MHRCIGALKEMARLVSGPVAKGYHERCDYNAGLYWLPSLEVSILDSLTLLSGSAS